MEYYKILEVDRFASTDDIKRAYRRLAREYHPDLNPGKNTATHFIRIKRAYDILHDPVQRQIYDDSICYSSSSSAAKQDSSAYSAYTGQTDPVNTRKEKPVEESKSSSTQLLAFQLGQEEYAIEVGDVLGITGCSTITPPAYGNSVIDGMVNMRGEELPVIDLASYFGFVSEVKPEMKRIIQVAIDGVRVGFIVDTAPQMVDIPSEMIFEMPASPTGKQVSYMQVGKIDGRIIFILDLDQILSPLTLAVLKEMT